MTNQQMREVWGLLSENPQATLEQVAKSTGVSRYKAFRLVSGLKSLGYVENSGRARAWRIKVPLFLERKPICTGTDPLRCDDPKCPVHGGG